MKDFLRFTSTDDDNPDSPRRVWVLLQAPATYKDGKWAIELDPRNDGDQPVVRYWSEMGLTIEDHKEQQQ
jgi:hypothetical protein